MVASSTDDEPDDGPSTYTRAVARGTTRSQVCFACWHFLRVGAIISPSRTDTKSVISPAPKLSPKTLKNTEMTTTNPNTKP